MTTKTTLTKPSSDGIGKLQSYNVVTAVPVLLILLLSLWDTLRITLMLGREATTAQAFTR